MSYDVVLQDTNNKIVKVEKFIDGGTFVLGGSEEADLNITYNYSKYYYKYLDKKDGIKFLDGKKAGDCIALLKVAVLALGTDRNLNYWKATPGNAGYALSILLRWAEANPDAIFQVR